MKIDVQKIIAELEAARSYIDRVEFSVRQLAAGQKDEQLPPCPSDPTAVCAFKKPSQDELFDTSVYADGEPNASDAEENPLDQAKFVRGEPTLTRSQVNALFSQIANDRDILDRGDVNQIFGYSRTTNGSFVSHAIKRGELGFVACGSQMKFLAIDVKNFIKTYFDRKSRSSNKNKENK